MNKIVRFTRFTKSIIRRPKFITKRSFKTFKEEDFLRDLRNVTWFDLFMTEDTDTAAVLLTTKIKEVLDDHAPVKTYQVRKNYAPWLTEYTKALMKERDDAQKVSANSKNPDDYRLFKHLRNDVTKHLRKEKREYERKRFENAEKDPAALWSNVKTVLKWANNGPRNSTFN